MAPDSSPLFEQQRPQLEAIARSITRSREDAQDVVQEVWLRYRRHHRDLVCAPAWLRTVTTRVAIDHVRARTRHLTVADTDLLETRAPDGEVVTPVDVVLGRERLREGVGMVLACLSPLERVVLVGRDFGGLGYADLAAHLGRSQPAVRQLHHRALAHLREPTPRFRVGRQQLDDVVRHVELAALTGHLDGLLASLWPRAAVAAAG